MSTVKEPVFALPPYTVEHVFAAMSETMDWSLKLLGIPCLWRVAKGENLTVAVLDSGIATSHPDFRGAIGKTKNFTKSKSGIVDVHGHGTHVAGIIGARQNSSGVIGVAPECKLMIAKVLDDYGTGTLAAICDGITWAADNGADIISLSLGTPSDDPRLRRVIDAVVAAGKFVVCAAGNEGPTMDTVGYPAMYPNVISVGAIDQTRKIAKFSSRGTRVDIVAPGVDILSTYPPRNLAKLSGSSMACPFVSGVMAIMLSKHQKYGTNHTIVTPAQMIEHLRETAVDVGPDGFDPAYGYGIIDPKALMESVETVQAKSLALALNRKDFSAKGWKRIMEQFGDVSQVRAVSGS